MRRLSKNSLYLDANAYMVQNGDNILCHTVIYWEGAPNLPEIAKAVTESTASPVRILYDESEYFTPNQSLHPLRYASPYLRHGICTGPPVIRHFRRYRFQETLAKTMVEGSHLGSSLLFTGKKS